MIKKISAIVLALVLCLSVVVMPVSAYEIADGKKIAYEIKLDKENYSAGDTVTVSLFIHGETDLEFAAGAIVFGCHSSAFSTTTNAAATVKASSTMEETAATYYKDVNGQTWAWQTNATIYNNIVNSNTAEENELFDQYIKVGINKLGSNGSHELAADTSRGYPANDLNANNAEGIPFITFQLTLRDDLADGTTINVGIPTGTMPKSYTYLNYLNDPGNSTKVTKTTAADSEVVWATATIGAATPELTIVKDKTQINFDVDGNKLYEGKFAIRQFVEFDNLLDVFGTLAEAKDGADGTGLTEIGFVYATTDSYNKTDALAVIDAGASSGAYTLDNDAYISTTSKANSFVMGYTVKNIADKSVSLTILAYAKYVVNGEEAIATIEIAGDYSDIYSTYESKIPPVNPEA